MADRDTRMLTWAEGRDAHEETYERGYATGLAVGELKRLLKAQKALASEYEWAEAGVVHVEAQLRALLSEGEV